VHVLQLLNELYHEDKGFNRTYTVLLSPKPPSMDVQHVLATHAASQKVVYLQGSPFKTMVGVAVLWCAALCCACPGPAKRHNAAHLLPACRT
jgi:hypothetical protein